MSHADDPSKLPVSKGGSQIHRHEPNMRREKGVTYLTDAEMDAYCAHLAKHMGPNSTVLHEIISELVHLDLVPVEPTPKHPFYLLSTMGMSARPMHLPKEARGEVSPFSEVCIALPPKWPRVDASAKDMGEDAFWPYRWLKNVARLPFEYETWVGIGHSIPNEDPPEPFAPNTPFVGVLLLDASIYIPGLETVKLSPKREVTVLSMVPLFEDEMNFKLDEGTEALAERIDASKLEAWQLADPRRASVCAK